MILIKINVNKIRSTTQAKRCRPGTETRLDCRNGFYAVAKLNQLPPIHFTFVFEFGFQIQIKIQK